MEGPLVKRAKLVNCSPNSHLVSDELLKTWHLNLDLISTQLLSGCLCSVPRLELHTPPQNNENFEKNHENYTYYHTLKNYNLEFLSTLTLLGEIGNSQRSSGFICEKIYEMLQVIISQESIWTFILTSFGSGDKFIAFSASKALISLMIYKRSSGLQPIFEELLKNSIFSTSMYANLTFGLFRTILEYAEEEMSSGFKNGCKKIEINLEEDSESEMKSVCIKRLENWWSRLVGKYQNSMGQEGDFVSFLELWQTLVSTKTNLNAVETKHFYGEVKNFLPLLSPTLSPILWGKILDVFNEILCYGSTLSLQEGLPDEPCDLAHIILRSIKTKNLLNLLPNDKNRLGVGGNDFEPHSQLIWENLSIKSRQNHDNNLVNSAQIPYKIFQDSDKPTSENYAQNLFKSSQNSNETSHNSSKTSQNSGSTFIYSPQNFSQTSQNSSDTSRNPSKTFQNPYETSHNSSNTSQISSSTSHNSDNILIYSPPQNSSQTSRNPYETSHTSSKSPTYSPYTSSSTSRPSSPASRIFSPTSPPSSSIPTPPPSSSLIYLGPTPEFVPTIAENSHSSHRLLLQKLILLVLKCLATTVRETKDESEYSDESGDDEGGRGEGGDEDEGVSEGEFNDMVIIERSVREILSIVDSYVKRNVEGVGEREEICEWVVRLFEEQDDVLVEGMLCTLDTFTSFIGRIDICSEFYSMCNPVLTFVSFLKIVHWDSEVLLDFLMGNETCFLLYFLRFLKYSWKYWAKFTTTVGDEKDNVIGVLLKLKASLDRLVEKSLFPYNINPIIRLLERIEEVEEEEGQNS